MSRTLSEATAKVNEGDCEQGTFELRVRDAAGYLRSAS